MSEGRTARPVEQVRADIKLTGLGQRLRDVLAITKLATVFEVYDTDEEAIAAFKSGHS